jgi:ADP-L-glycero-D-manno-heptose 6-epimerase
VGDVVAVLIWLIDSPDANGLFNVGTGASRTYREVVGAVCAAAGVSDRVEFIDMPAPLRGQYQNFTQARVDRLRAAGFAVPWTGLEDGVRVYVQKYLMQPDPYL